MNPIFGNCSGNVSLPICILVCACVCVEKAPLKTSKEIISRLEEQKNGFYKKSEAENYNFNKHGKMS